MFSHARVSRRLSKKPQRTPGQDSNSGTFGQGHRGVINGNRTGYQGFILSNTRSDPTMGTSVDSEKDRNKSEHTSNKPLQRDSLDGIFFTKLADLEKWYEDSEKYDLYDQFRIPRQELGSYRRNKVSNSGSVRLSVCHDFKGNYLNNEDNNPLGYYPHPSGNHYFLQFPNLVDHFIYFSHNFISVPTVSWINNCHKFGLKCLGTIIVEGNHVENFEQLSALCTMNQENTEFVYIKMLLKLVEHYKFDGYLINIETKFLDRSEATRIEQFIDQLRVSLQIQKPTNRLVWYDSFIPSINNIKYENGVTSHNYSLFKKSDYFLTNYWWDENNLKKNVAIAGLHGVKSSVFVGIDLWGRGTKIGSGGFDTPLAVNFCKAYDTNVCLFAPGWTYEYLGERDFLKNDLKLWRYNAEGNDTISDFINGYTSCCYYPDDKSFIFYTNFSNGQGNIFFVEGKPVFNNNWVNLNYQYEIPDIVFEKDSKLSKYNFLNFTIDNDEGYIGGSSLKIVKNNDQILIDDGEKIADDITNKILFRFNNDCDNDNIIVKLSYKYNIVNKKNNEIFETSLSSIVEKQMQGYFQLELNYKIEKRYKKYYTVNGGKLTVPLQILMPSMADNNKNKNNCIETDWKVLTTAFQTPKGVKWEYCVIESVSISWIDNSLVPRNSSSEIFSNVYNVANSSDYSSSEEGDETSELDDEWIILPDNLDPSYFTELYIGDFAIVSMSSEEFEKLPTVNGNKVKSLKKSKALENSTKMYVEWEDNEDTKKNVSYWNVFINGEFVGVSTFSHWIIDLKALDLKKSKTINVRIDIVNRIGDIITGDEISVKI